jgi:cytochrome c oxidase accessory protein FixG
LSSNDVTTNTPSQNSAEGELYQKHKKVYVREVHGLFASLRNVAMVALLGLYYGMAWINWGGHQAILFDLPARKFYIFGLVFWPQDFIYLSGLLIIAAIALFMFTSLAGRLWCGYACPQTVWTEIYMWMERLVEGDGRKQRKLDQGARDISYFRKKIAKHSLWLAFSLWTGFTFVGYFTPIRELAQHFVTWNLGPWETFWIFFYGFATYGNAGFLREQVCIYMCPYARFQSAMFDRDTLIVSYDEKRGEPRGMHKRNAEISEQEAKGDCVDCGLCVQVCPTGIDIRNGLQYQCIGCAACVDVCDQVMEKVGSPKGLIRYTTENGLEGKPVHILRPRLFVYIGIISLVIGLLFYAILTRTALEVDVIRDRSSLYTENDMGMIENVYNIKVINMDEHPHDFSIEVEGLEGIHLVGDKKPVVRVESGAVEQIPMRVEVDPESITQRSSEIYFNVVAADDPELKRHEPAKFLGPTTQ